MTSQLKVDRISPATGSEIIIDGWERNHYKKNLIINGAMTVSQRGETFDKGGYTLDRWYIGSSGYNISRGTALNQFDYSLECVRPPANSANSYIQQRIELDKNGSPGIFEQGKEFTISCWVKGTAGAEFSIRMGFSKGSDEDGATRTDFSDGSGDVRGNVINLTGGWDRYENTVTVDQPCNSDHNSVCVSLSYYGSAVNQTVWITGVQAEKGQNATEFEQETFGETLKRCKRYYQKSYPYYVDIGTNTAANQTLLSLFSTSNTTRYFPVGNYFEVEFMHAPTVHIYARAGQENTINQYNSGATVLNVTDFTQAQSKTLPNWLTVENSTSDYPFQFHWTAEAEL